jgi:D-alanyl-D-alanine carboxypeptidase
VLYEREAFEARSPASLTKMVTALVVMDRCALDDVAVASERAAMAEGSQLGLREDDRITVGELLKGLLLPSGNDCATCLAEHVAGTEAAFAELMNAKAAELGAVNTHFANASGLTVEGHYSCARDLAVFGLALRLQPYLAEVVRQPSATVRWASGKSVTVWNLNRLLSRCQGCDGVKTGYTSAAGRCLAASAVRDGYPLMCVVLNSPDSWYESGALLNWGFAQPPVGVIEVPRDDAEPVRLPAPIVESKLQVDADELWEALGPQVTADILERLPGPFLGAALPRPWRGKSLVPAGALCSHWGLQLSWDKASLTATVEPRPALPAP